MEAILALEDGTWFRGRSFTGEGETSGEAIFNTGMSGYQEVLTDPSYVGQMVCMTYPHQGNYGVNLDDVESGRIRVEAFLVKECCREPSNWRATSTLPDYLRDAGVMGVEGIDTRALTRHLRLNGAMRGILSTREPDPAILSARAREIPSMEGLNLAEKVTPQTPYAWRDGRPVEVELNANGSYDWPGPGPRLVIFDFGVKWNILRLMAAQGFDMLMVPSSYDKDKVDALAPDAVFLSPGPGDPAALPQVIENILPLTEAYPTGGICLGHQLLGSAFGGTTSKLKFGHHGCNHPVKDLETGRIEISSQNHGFVVNIDGLDFLETTHRNLNDGTLEGFRHKKLPVITLQYHPEAGPGPHDSRFFFGRFRRLVREATGK
ncbi:glutamine-hydrolyzing carbamoyl-phosphate synthase small subunit [Desulfohalovibrio reitneri]|uniref:glutamine-hydrolyzing carbamoyl-phosphate synthase small subunit n=1 Tax=Desulfohalovibrio reitneri TaxID=1307759 RepID=UPI0004A6CF33|nr:glutamine-hydrolyzing carbamoyl-phosphate synthase small subunit [Desulfohalovibrio reitneri]